MQSCPPRALSLSGSDFKPMFYPLSHHLPLYMATCPRFPLSYLRIQAPCLPGSLPVWIIRRRVRERDIDRKREREWGGGGWEGRGAGRDLRHWKMDWRRCGRGRGTLMVGRWLTGRQEQVWLCFNQTPFTFQAWRWPKCLGYFLLSCVDTETVLSPGCSAL